MIETRRHVAAAVLCCTFAATACAAEPPLDFPDWILPVPDGTPIREYAPVPREERDADAIMLVEDLVIGGEPDSMFFPISIRSLMIALAVGNLPAPLP